MKRIRLFTLADTKSGTEVQLDLEHPISIWNRRNLNARRSQPRVALLGLISAARPENAPLDLLSAQPGEDSTHDPANSRVESSRSTLGN